MSPNVIERMRAVDAALKAKDAEPALDAEYAQARREALLRLEAAARPQYERRLIENALNAQPFI